MNAFHFMLGIFAVVIGASVGSFLNAVADRVTEGRCILWPMTYCEGCERHLSFVDMIPVLRYLWPQGKCQNCEAGIHPKALLVEVATGGLFLAVYLIYGFGVDFVILASCLSLLVVVSVTDLEKGLILDVMVFPSIVLLLIMAPFWTEIGFSREFLGDETLLASFANSSLSGLGAFLAFLIVAMINPAGMGGGDVKFAAALGLMVGFPGILMALWISVIGVGIFAIILILTSKKGRKDTIPFGPFMAVGAAVVLIAGPDIINWYQDLASAVSGS